MMRRIFEDLAKEIQERSGFAAIWQGRTGRTYTEGASCFPQKCGPIQFRATRTTHLRDLAQALSIGFPKGIIHVKGRAVTFFFPLLN